MKITDFTRERTNFWRSADGKKSYRLFAKGITPNGCWLIAPKMVKLVDIDIATGNNIYGQELVFPNTLDTKKKYRATVTDHPEYGNWILSHDGHTWNATKPGGAVLASAHWWDIGGAA